MTTETITLTALRAHLAEDTGFWSARTSDYGIEDDTHLPAWEWIHRAPELELDAAVQVRHPEITGGGWLTVVVD